ncbi:MAG TPA: right-handed parallel beta-helix repeat-containing protein [Burkholderiales bacterium]
MTAARALRGWPPLLALLALAGCATPAPQAPAEPAAAPALPPDAQRLLYVDPSGKCDGRTPCYRTLGEATLDSLQSQLDSQRRPLRPNAPPDRIIVMPGVYTAARPGDWVLILGFNGEDGISGIWKLELIAEQGPGVTVISGQDTSPCLWTIDHIELTVRGFTFTGCTDVDPNVRNDDYAVYVQSFLNAKIRLEGNVFHDNSSSAAVIGISPFYANVANLDVRVVGNRFYGNFAAIHVLSLPESVLPAYSASVLIANNLIHDNGRETSEYSAGGVRIFNRVIAAQSIRINVVNNTIAYNRGVGLSLVETQGINVQNNIVAGNGVDIDEWLANSRVNANLVGSATGLSSPGNLLDDPMFVNPSAGDFTLAKGSPAIDAAATLPIPELRVDILGNPRPADGDGDGTAAVDMGAIEVQ